MLSQKMIPYLWARLVATLVFAGFVAWQSMWLLRVIAIGLAALTSFQLRTAYQHREHK